jgi:hypothetical protein
VSESENPNTVTVIRMGPEVGFSVFFYPGKRPVLSQNQD